MDKMGDIALLRIESVELFEKAKLLNVFDEKTKMEAVRVLGRAKSILDEAKGLLKDNTDAAVKASLEKTLGYVSNVEGFVNKTYQSYIAGKNAEKQAEVDLENARAEKLKLIEKTNKEFNARHPEQAVALRGKSAK